MKPPFRLVPDSISHDTVECVTELLELAKKGELIGLAFAGMLRRRTFIVNTAGAAYESPTFTRGMVSALDDQLGSRLRQE